MKRSATKNYSPQSARKASRAPDSKSCASASGKSGCSPADSQSETKPQESKSCFQVFPSSIESIAQGGESNVSCPPKTETPGQRERRRKGDSAHSCRGIGNAPKINRDYIVHTPNGGK